MKIEYNKKEIGIGDIVKYNDNICIIAYDDDYEVDFPYYVIDLSTMGVVGAFESIEVINKVEENNYLYENNGLNVYINEIEKIKEIGKYDGVKFLPFKILK